MALTMAYFALCENLRCWHFLRLRCSWLLRHKVAVRRLPLMGQEVRDREDRPAAAGEWAADPHRVEWRALGAISFLTRGVVAPAMNRVTEAYARMVFVAPRNSRAEVSVVIPDKCVPFKNVFYLVSHVRIRMNAALRNIVNIRSVTPVIWEMPTRAVWAARKCRRGNVYQGPRRARPECLRRNPMIRSRASKLVNTNRLHLHFHRN